MLPVSNGKSALVFGATSSLGVALSRALAARGFKLVLCGRDGEELVRLAADLQTRYGIMASPIPCNLKSPAALAQVSDYAAHIDDVWMLAGDMGSADRDDIDNLTTIAWVNYTAPAILLAQFAKAFEARRHGRIAVVTSVAGDRGRQSNYPYGSAKAGLIAFASGLRNRLHAAGVQVLTIKPGFMDTPMTFGMRSPLIASRERCAELMIRALEKGKDVAYIPWFWEYIMGIICHIPEKIFKKLSL